jgi:RNA polymerase sigma factor (sigma-70 family)
MSTLSIDHAWEQYYPRIYGYFFRRLNNRLDVEDLTSITLSEFIEVLLDDTKCSRIRDLEDYLWKIAHNQLVGFIDKKSKIKITVGLSDETDSIDTNIDSIDSENYKFRTQALMECVEKELKSTDYQIVVMSLIEDRKSPEVAQVLSLTSVNVRKKLERAIAKLREKCRAVWHR